MIVLTSPTDSEAEVTRALESAGLIMDSVETQNTDAPEPEKDKEVIPAVPAVEAQVEAPAEKDKTTPAPETEEAVEPDKAKPGPKPGAGVQKRIDELTREKYERDGTIAELKRQNAELSKPAEAKPAAAPDSTEQKPVVEAKPKPVVGDYADYDAFVEALTDWKTDAREAKLTAAFEAKLEAKLAASEAKQTQASETDALQTEWNAKLADAATRYPDWDAVKEAATEVSVSAAMKDAYSEDPLGADVLYYLASHPEDAARVYAATHYDPATTSPRDVLARNRAAGSELARIKALIPAVKAPEVTPAAATPAAKPKPRAASAAPAPIEPARAGAASGGIDPYDTSKTMTAAEYNAWRDTHSRG